MMNFEDRISGMNTHYRYFSLDYFLESCVNNGLKNIELWTCPHHFMLGNAQFVEPVDLKETLFINKLNLVSLCPEQNNPKLHNIASDNKEIQRLTFNYFSNAIRTAHYLKCPTVLITSGWARYDESLSLAWARSVEMLRKISEVAEQYDIQLALEALQPNESMIVNNVSDLKKMREEVGSEKLKVCIDFGAMAKAEESLNDYFDSFGQDIVHIHFVDGEPTGHLAWGDGIRDVKRDLETLKKYNYSGYCSLEYANEKYFATPSDIDLKSLEYIRRKVNG